MFKFILLLLVMPVWAVLPIVIHEFAHWAVAKMLGTNIKFKLTYGNLGAFLIPFTAKAVGPIKIPRFTWKLPTDVSLGKLKLICIAGFAAELVMIPIFDNAIYSTVALVHFILYSFYAGEKSDFRIFCCSTKTTVY